MRSSYSKATICSVLCEGQGAPDASALNKDASIAAEWPQSSHRSPFTMRPVQFVQNLAWPPNSMSSSSLLASKSLAPLLALRSCNRR